MWYCSDTKMQQNIVDLIALSYQLFLRFGGLYLLTCVMLSVHMVFNWSGSV